MWLANISFQLLTFNNIVKSIVDFLGAKQVFFNKAIIILAMNSMKNTITYTEDNIRSLDWKEHIRLRPGMYIGKLGDGSSPDDGIYILLKEILDNCIDEFVMGAGKTIEIIINENNVSVRDYGRGIPLGKVIDVVSKMNTGGKYDSRAFKKSVGLNGVGTKAVNALSETFIVESIRENQTKKVKFEFGIVTEDSPLEKSNKRRGTKVIFSQIEKYLKILNIDQNMLSA